MELNAKKDFDIIVCLPTINNGDTLTIGTTNTLLYNSFLLKECQDTLSFKNYLHQLLNKIVVVDSNSLEDYFICNKTRIDTLQEENGFDYLKSNFVVQKKENQFVPIDGLTQLEIYSLVRVFFNEEYIIVFDDYSGNFIFNDKGYKQK
ncbi:MAG TPA: hypothetical protein VE912_09370 [Bacteroidales bacterium]|nr:hypothetical protein [Bacteroidales bacterium]